MSELSRCLGNEGNPFEIKASKKTYKLKLVDQAIKVNFEKRLYEHAKHAVLLLRKDLTSDEFMSLLKDLTQSYQDGDFDMAGPRGKKAMEGHLGALTLLSLLMGCDELEAAQVAQEKPEEFQAAMKAIMHESFPHIRNVEVEEEEDGKKM
jgi:vacuolar-type H+-ATPase subunit D/Vma8